MLGALPWLTRGGGYVLYIILELQWREYGQHAGRYGQEMDK